MSSAAGTMMRVASKADDKENPEVVSGKGVRVLSVSKPSLFPSSLVVIVINQSDKVNLCFRVTDTCVDRAHFLGENTSQARRHLHQTAINHIRVDDIACLVPVGSEQHMTEDTCHASFPLFYFILSYCFSALVDHPTQPPQHAVLVF